jgi:colicin import membrane protein
MSAVMEVDPETGEIIPATVMIKTEKPPAIIIDINDVALYHSEPEKLVDKIRAQAGFAVFDISNEKGRAACRSHSANIIKCIAPAVAASKALAAEAQKVVKQDLRFRKIFEEDVREIAEFHRRPLTEYESELQRVKDEYEAAEAAKIAEARRIEEEAEAEKQRLFEEEKAKFEAEKREMEQEKQRIADERAKIELEKKLRAEAEEQRIRLAEKAEKDRINAELAAQQALVRAEKEKQEAIAAAELKAKQEAEEKERQARIDEEKRLEKIRIDRLEAERKAKNAPDKDKLIALAESIAAINFPEVGEEAKRVIDETEILLGKVCNFIHTRAAKL